MLRLTGQESALVANYDGTGIQLKWFSAGFVYPNGVTVFRKEGGGDWKKLNSDPIRLKNGVFVYSGNEGISMVLEAVATKKRFEGLVYLNALVQCFQNNALCSHLGIYYMDETAAANSSYTYKVVAGNDRQIGKEILVNTDIPSEVPAPINFGFKQKRKKIDFYWSSNTNEFFGVNLYAKINGGPEAALTDLPIMAAGVKKDSAAQKQYELVLEENTTYEIRARSMGFFEDVSEPSETILVEINDYTPPAAPKGLMQKGLVKKHTVGLEWTSYNDRSAFGLKIYRSLYYDSAYVDLTPIPLFIESEEFVDEVPAPGDYYYCVAAVDAAGNENRSMKTVVHVEDMEGPNVLEQITAREDTGKVFLTWSGSKAPDLRGYFVYRSLVGKDDFVLMNSTPLQDTSFIDLLPKRTRSTFRYYVVAQDLTYNYSEPSEVVEATMPDVVAPERPLIKNASAVKNGVRISWLPNVDLDLSEYHIFRKKKGDTLYNLIGTAGAGSTSITDTAVEWATVYHYKMMALDGSGNRSVFSNTFTVQTEFRQPQEQVSISVKVKKKKKLKTIQLTWKAKPDVLGYVVYSMEGKKLKQLSGMKTDGSFVLKSENEQESIIIKGYTNGPLVYASERLNIDW